MTEPLQQLVGDARAAFAAAAVSIAVLDEDVGELVYRVSSGAGADRIVGVRLPVTRGIAGWVAVSGQALAVADLRHDARFALDVAESTDYVPDTLLVAPLLGPEGVLGVLSVLDRDTTRPDAAQDMALAGAWAARAATALDDGTSAAELPELRDVTAALHGGDPARRRLVRDALRRLLEDQP